MAELLVPAAKGIDQEKTTLAKWKTWKDAVEKLSTMGSLRFFLEDSSSKDLVEPSSKLFIQRISDESFGAFAARASQMVLNKYLVAANANLVATQAANTQQLDASASSKCKHKFLIFASE